jgi:hypothetical protein
MSKDLLKYYFFPLVYLVAVLLMEFFPIIMLLSMAVWGLSILLCIIGFIRIPLKKITPLRKYILLLLLSIPLIDTTFGIHIRILNLIKGEIVFHAINDSFATTRSIIIREKNGLLKGEYDFSVVGWVNPNRPM